MKQTHTVRWVLYHEPLELFIRTAEAFAKEIAILTDGRINIEIYTLPEYAAKFTNGTEFDPMTLMENNDIEMTQVQVGQLGQWNATDMFALELPFLFSSHEHATRVLEGEIGQSLLSGLTETTPTTGLAFTYSGGYRCIASDRLVKTVEDLKNLEIITYLNPVMVDTATAFGCIPVPIHNGTLEEADRAIKMTTSAVETTLPRYEKEANPELHKYVANTKHSMYLTSIIVNTEFWNTLSDEDQAAMRQAALITSRLEREWSVNDANEISDSVEKQKSLGINFSEFDVEATAELKALSQPIIDKYKEFFTPGLVDGIIRG